MFKKKMNIKADFFPFNFFFYIDSFVSHDKNKESMEFYTCQWPDSCDSVYISV